jgi:phosphate transport system substrate-binding protein
MKTFLAGLALAGHLSVALGQSISGAGASFPAPLYSKWAEAYEKATGVRVAYQSIGSGAGLRQIRARMVDFGASDAPLTTDELNKDGTVLQFPTAIGGVVPVVNLPGMHGAALRLTGPVLADIYLGKIQKWNDAAIVALNPDVQLPDAQIAVIRRADGSGTTFLFTSFLSKVSPEWKSKVGEGLSVNWPIGVGAKGNEAAAKFVKNLPNSIGYIEYSHAKSNQLAHAMLMNTAGIYVTPGASAFMAAAAGTRWHGNLHQSLTNQPGKDAWPITGATFVVVPLKPAQPKATQSVIRFFDWAYTHGGQIAGELGYVPLSESVQALVRQEWSKVMTDSGRLASAR